MNDIVNTPAAESPATEVVTGEKRKRKPYVLKANTKSSQVRALVRRWHKHPYAEKIILEKTMALGFTRALAKAYIKGSARCQGIVLPTLAPALEPAAE